MTKKRTVKQQQDALNIALGSGGLGKLAKVTGTTLGKAIDLGLKGYTLEQIVEKMAKDMVPSRVPKVSKDLNYRQETKKNFKSHGQKVTVPISPPNAPPTLNELYEQKKQETLAKAIKVQKAINTSVAKQTGKPASPPLARRSLLAPARTLTDVHPSSPSKVEKSATLSPYGHPPQERRRSLLDDPNPSASTIAEKMAARQRARRAAIENSKNDQNPTSPERYSANDFAFEDARANNQARQMAEDKARRDRENASKGGASNSGTNRGGPGMGGSYGGGGDGFDPSGRFHQGGLIDDGDPSGASPAQPIIAQEGEFVLSKKAVTSLGVETVAHLNALASTAPHQASRVSEALNQIAGGPPKDIEALIVMLLDDRYLKGQPGERDDYYAKVRREFKLVYPGDGQGRPILFDGGLIDDGDASTRLDDYPIRAPEGVFVLSRRAVAIFGPHLLNRINAASHANDMVLIKAVKKALAGMFEPIAA